MALAKLRRMKQRWVLRDTENVSSVIEAVNQTAGLFHVI